MFFHVAHRLQPGIISNTSQKSEPWLQLLPPLIGEGRGEIFEIVAENLWLTLTQDSYREHLFPHYHMNRLWADWEGVHTRVPLCSGQGTNLDMYPFLKKLKNHMHACVTCLPLPTLSTLSNYSLMVKKVIPLFHSTIPFQWNIPLIQYRRHQCVKIFSKHSCPP